MCIYLTSLLFPIDPSVKILRFKALANKGLIGHIFDNALAHRSVFQFVAYALLCVLKDPASPVGYLVVNDAFLDIL